ncbi:hypothetical protein BMT54_01040 [Pasteurellaceae bacterium 15-036681]|nr:hypothetical protein BMT54_01040 [Pasteurellaceae bacterium 15-036681]
MKKLLPAGLAIALALLISYLMMVGSGFFPTPELKDVFALGAVILFLSASRKAFYFVLFPIVFAYAFYTPTGLTFGPPSYQYIASVFATDLSETKEFLSQIPALHYAAGFGILFAMAFFYTLVRMYDLRFYRNKTFVTVALLCIFVTSAPFKFLQESYDSTVKVKNELDRLNNMTIESQWGKSELTTDSKYDDYILVIGESARRDYHNAYGYPADNTPFMSHAKGTLINGLTAGGTNTIASLKLMLTKPDTKNWEGEYTLGLIDLIKSTGIRTYWLSNQGYLGTFDTPVSSLANKSDEKVFLKSGDSFSQNISDFELLPLFDKTISQPYQGKRFIVVHLYGSHPLSCDRLTDYHKVYDDTKIDKKYHDVNCYVSTIKKTDEVLEKLYKQLVNHQQQTQRSFSMVYFADHGLAHQISENSIVIHNSSGKSKLHLDIPLFKISSDDTERHEYKVFKSGLNFTDGIAKWMGISNPKLNEKADLFSNQSDADDYGQKEIIEKFDGIVDPAVVIPVKNNSQ